MNKKYTKNKEKTDLTKLEALTLLHHSVTDEGIKDYPLEAHVEAEMNLRSRGYLEAVDITLSVITTQGKERVANHILKEKKLPNYLNHNSLGMKFDAFLSTATSNAVNGFLLSLLNQGKLKGIDKRTLANLEAESNKEIQRQEAVKHLNLSVNGF